MSSHLDLVEKISDAINVIEEMKICGSRNAILAQFEDCKTFEDFLKFIQHLLKCLEECAKVNEAIKEGLVAVQESVSVCVKELDLIKKSIEQRYRDMEVKERELRLFRREMTMKVMQLVDLKKSVDERFEQIIFKEMRIGDRSIELDLKERCLAERVKEVDLKEMKLVSMEEALEARENKLQSIWTPNQKMLTQEKELTAHCDKNKELPEEPGSAMMQNSRDSLKDCSRKRSRGLVTSEKDEQQAQHVSRDSDGEACPWKRGKSAVDAEKKQKEEAGNC